MYDKLSCAPIIGKCDAREVNLEMVVIHTADCVNIFCTLTIKRGCNGRMLVQDGFCTNHKTFSLHTSSSTVTFLTMHPPVKCPGQCRCIVMQGIRIVHLQWALKVKNVNEAYKVRKSSSGMNYNAGFQVLGVSGIYLACRHSLHECPFCFV